MTDTDRHALLTNLAAALGWRNPADGGKLTDRPDRILAWPPDGTYRSPVTWNPAADWRDAGELLEEMVLRGFRPEVAFMPVEGAGDWTVEIKAGNGFDELGCAYEDAPCEAIVKACLAALESTVP